MAFVSGASSIFVVLLALLSYAHGQIVNVTNAYVLGSPTISQCTFDSATTQIVVQGDNIASATAVLFGSTSYPSTSFTTSVGPPNTITLAANVVTFPSSTLKPIRVTVGGVTYPTLPMANISFAFTPAIISMSPASVPYQTFRSARWIYVRGRGFAFNSGSGSLACRFSGSSVDFTTFAELLNSTSVRCLAPNTAQGGIFKFYVSADYTGNITTSHWSPLPTETTLYFHVVPDLTAVNQTSLYYDTVTPLLLTTKGMPPAWLGNIQCVFMTGGSPAAVPVVYIGSQYVCNWPVCGLGACNAMVSAVLVRLRTVDPAGVQYLSSTDVYITLSVRILHVVVNSFGSPSTFVPGSPNLQMTALQNATVSVVVTPPPSIGTSANRTLCLFKDLATNKVYRTPGTIANSVSLPSSPQQNFVHCPFKGSYTSTKLVVAVSYDDGDAVSPYGTQQITISPFIAHINKTLGNINTPTIVAVEGAGLSTRLKCQFGNNTATSMYQCGPTFCCVAQSSTLSVVQLVLTDPFTNVMSVASSAVATQFQFVGPPVINSISPTSGFLRGNTPVNILGSGFYKSTSLVCKFDSLSVTTYWVSDSEIVCLSPPSLAVSQDPMIRVYNHYGGISGPYQWRYIVNVTTASSYRGVLATWKDYDMPGLPVLASKNLIPVSSPSEDLQYRYGQQALLQSSITLQSQQRGYNASDDLLNPSSSIVHSAVGSSLAEGTIEFWFFLRSGSDSDFYTTSSDINRISLTNGRARLNSKLATILLDCSINYSLRVNKWYHFARTYRKPGFHDVYFNGIPLCSTKSSSTLDFPQGTFRWNGGTYLRQIGIWSYRKLGTDIRRGMGTVYTTAQPFMLLYWSMVKPTSNTNLVDVATGVVVSSYTPESVPRPVPLENHMVWIEWFNSAGASCTSPVATEMRTGLSESEWDCGTWGHYLCRVTLVFYVPYDGTIEFIGSGCDYLEVDNQYFPAQTLNKGWYTKVIDCLGSQSGRTVTLRLNGGTLGTNPSDIWGTMRYAGARVSYRGVMQSSSTLNLRAMLYMTQFPNRPAAVAYNDGNFNDDLSGTPTPTANFACYGDNVITTLTRNEYIVGPGGCTLDCSMMKVCLNLNNCSFPIDRCLLSQIQDSSTVCSDTPRLKVDVICQTPNYVRVYLNGTLFQEKSFDVGSQFVDLQFNAITVSSNTQYEIRLEGPHAAGVRMDLCSGNQNPLPSGYNFINTEHWDPQISSLSPAETWNYGHVNITISGTNFPTGTAVTSDAVCKFGQRLSKLYVTSTPDTVYCQAPQLSGTISALVTVDISFNGVDFTSSSATFIYKGSCGLGYFCPDSFTRTICPAGTYCPTVHMQHPLPCIPGTYQSQPGQANCTACTTANHCPNPGMTSVISCPAGYICDTPGIATSLKICPRGYYCKGATSSAVLNNASSEVATQPNQCAAEFYCAEGVTQSLTLLTGSEQFYTPQPCLSGVTCARGSDNPNGQGCPKGMFCFSVNNGAVLSEAAPFVDFSDPFNPVCILALRDPRGARSCACPRGYQCPDTDMQAPTACTPGYWQDTLRSQSCKPCSVGYYCPYSNMTSQIVCDQGSVCSVNNLTTPNAQCPAGSYCGSGVNTLIVDTTGQQPTSPRLCAPGTFCMPGVIFGPATVLDGNFSYPQTCIAGTYCFAGAPSPSGTDLCPPGHWCGAGSGDDGNAGTICAAGYYCPGTGNKGESQCLPGSYNGLEGQGSCTDCEPGYFCSRAQMLDHELCTPGLVCDEPNLSFVSKRCPAGYWCSWGTDSYTYNASNPRSPRLCPAGYYCISGVMTDISQDGNFTTPQKCGRGYYCELGSDKPGGRNGTAICPAGYYCPTGSAVPIAAPAGSFIASTGSSTSGELCSRGSYQDQNASTSCHTCPPGYECPREGMTAPVICPAGAYRLNNSDISCSLCPEGYFSPVVGSSDNNTCTACPEGLICGDQGLGNVSTAIPCYEGRVCPAGTSKSNFLTHSYLCPAGFACPAGSYPISGQAPYGSIPCPAGYICENGTELSQYTYNPCPEQYYCPEGMVPLNGLESGYRCPEGTTSPGQAQDVFACTRNTANINTAEFPHAQAPLKEINPFIAPNPVGFDLNTWKAETFSEFSSAPTISMSPLTVVYFTFNITLPARFDYKQFFDLAFYIGASGYSDSSIYSLDSSYSAYSSYLSPPNWGSSCLFHSWDNCSFTTLIPDTRNAANTTMCAFCADLISARRQFLMELPVSFTQQTPSRIQNITWAFKANVYQPTDLKVLINMWRGDFMNYSASFRNTFTYNVTTPFRSNLTKNQANSFVALMTESMSDIYNMPYNLPRNETLSLSFMQQPADTLLLVSDPSTSTLLSSQLYWQAIDESLFSGTGAYIPPTNGWIHMTHIPYISRCLEFGTTTLLSAILEDPRFCDLVPPNDTTVVPNLPPKYFDSAELVGDRCAVSLQCAYDEFTTDIPTPGTLYWWWEAQKISGPIFYITERSMTASEIESVSDWSAVRRIPVWGMPNRPSGSDRTYVPRTVILNLGYVQLDSTAKLLKMANLIYKDFESVDPLDATSVIFNGENVTTLNGRNFEFKIVWSPLAWMDQFNLFIFEANTYYTILGALLVILLSFIFVLWFVYRILYCCRRGKYPLHLFWCLRHMFISACIGYFMQLTPVGFMTWAIYQTFHDPSMADWGLDSTGVQSVNAADMATARCGIGFVILGFYLASNVSEAVGPISKESRGMNSGEKDPRLARRMAMSISQLLIVMLMSVLWELSGYSDLSETSNLYGFIVGLRGFGILLEAFLEVYLRDQLMVSALLLSINITTMAICLKAALFSDFLFVFVMYMAIEAFKRLYFDPIVHWIRKTREAKRSKQQPGKSFDRIANTEKQARSHMFKTEKEKQSERERQDRKAKAEKEQEVLSKKRIAKKEGSVRDLTSNSIAVMTLFHMPILVLFNFVFGADLGFDAGAVMYYLHFTWAAVLTKVLFDVFIQNINHLRFGRNNYAYLVAARKKYQQSDFLWQNFEDLAPDLELNPSLRTVDQLSFTAQYYFFLAANGTASALMVQGMSVMQKSGVSPLGDLYGVGLVFMIMLMCSAMALVCRIIGGLIVTTRRKDNIEAELLKRKVKELDRLYVEVDTFIAGLLRWLNDIFGSAEKYFRNRKAYLQRIADARLFGYEADDAELTGETSKSLSQLAAIFGANNKAEESDGESEPDWPTWPGEFDNWWGDSAPSKGGLLASVLSNIGFGGKGNADDKPPVDNNSTDDSTDEEAGSGDVGTLAEPLSPTWSSGSPGTPSKMRPHLPLKPGLNKEFTALVPDSAVVGSVSGKSTASTAVKRRTLRDLRRDSMSSTASAMNSALADSKVKRVDPHITRKNSDVSVASTSQLSAHSAESGGSEETVGASTPVVMSSKSSATPKKTVASKPAAPAVARAPSVASLVSMRSVAPAAKGVGPASAVPAAPAPIRVPSVASMVSMRSVIGQTKAPTAPAASAVPARAPSVASMPSVRSARPSRSPSPAPAGTSGPPLRPTGRIMSPSSQGVGSSPKSTGPPVKPGAPKKP